MAIRKYTIAPPFSHQTGDEYRRVGNQIEQLRSDIVIDTRPAVSSPLTGPEHVGSNSVSAIYEENGPVTKTITDVRLSGLGATLINFSDGSQRELAGGHVDGLALAESLDENGQLAEDLLIAKAYRHSPDGTSLDDIIGSTVTIDTSAENPVQFNLSQAVL